MRSRNPLQIENTRLAGRLRTLESKLLSVIEECASCAFDETTVCAAPIHCGCREKIAARIRARAALALAEEGPTP